MGIAPYRTQGGEIHPQKHHNRGTDVAHTVLMSLDHQQQFQDSRQMLRQLESLSELLQ
jgi:hypothetical protein